MKSALIFSAFCAATAMAQPHHHRRHVHAAPHRHQQRRNVEKRKVHTSWVIETATVTVTEYVDSTSTVIIDEDHGQAAAESKDAQFFEQPTPTQQPQAAAAPAETPQNNSPAENNNQQQQQQQPQTSAAPVANTPEPVQVEQPAYTPPAATPAASPAENGNSGNSNKEASGSASSGGNSGEMTYYKVGLGACGYDDSGKDQTDYIVALNVGQMGAQSNGNPNCGKKVKISYNGNSIIAEVRDKCPGCANGDLDVSEKAFNDLCGGLGAGRVHITWDWAS